MNRSHTSILHQLEMIWKILCWALSVFPKSFTSISARKLVFMELVGSCGSERGSGGGSDCG